MINELPKYPATFTFAKGLGCIEFQLAQGDGPHKVTSSQEVTDVTVQLDFDEKGNLVSMLVLDPFPVGTDIARSRRKKRKFFKKAIEFVTELI